MGKTITELVNRADIARREDRLNDAREDLTEALAICRESGTQDELIAVLKKLGQIERDMGHDGAALTLYKEAVSICREGNDQLMLAHTVRHVGDIHQEAGRAELAEPCYVEALALYRLNEQTHPLDLANAVRPLAILKEKAGEVAMAKQLWQEAKDLYAGVGVSEGVAESSDALKRLADT